MPDPTTAAQAEIARLQGIITALMDRAERSTLAQGPDFNLFQAALMLEEQVQKRTTELEVALRDNQEMAQALRQSEAMYHALVNQSLVGIAVVEEGRFTYVNPRLCEIAGYPAATLRGRSAIEFAVPEHQSQLRERLERRRFGDDGRSHYQVQCLRADGQRIDIEVHSNRAGLGGHAFVLTIQDITERCNAERKILRMQEQLREQSLRDPLTSLYNRRHLVEQLPRDLLLAGQQDEPVGLVMCDLDHFKSVNDRHGHLAGDRLLQATAELLRLNTRPGDSCYRFGGEEFLLVLPRADSDEATRMAQRLRAAIGTLTSEADGRPTPMSASFGVASFPADGRSMDCLLAAADAALYVAKADGRDRVATAAGACAMALRA
jgi:diguanylate cyclase (GGDEF)-like protein/PAS domain S-box-containing protein